MYIKYLIYIYNLNVIAIYNYFCRDFLGWCDIAVSNDHLDSQLFIQTYRLTSMYSVVKPPKDRNVSTVEVLNECSLKYCYVQTPKVLFIWVGRKEKEEVRKDANSNCLAGIRTEACCESNALLWLWNMSQRPERTL